MGQLLVAKRFKHSRFERRLVWREWRSGSAFMQNKSCILAPWAETVGHVSHVRLSFHFLRLDAHEACEPRLHKGTWPHGGSPISMNNGERQAHGVDRQEHDVETPA